LRNFNNFSMRGIYHMWFKPEIRYTAMPALCRKNTGIIQKSRRSYLIKKPRRISRSPETCCAEPNNFLPYDIFDYLFAMADIFFEFFTP